MNNSNPIRAVIAASAVALLLGVAACEREGPAERVGEEIDETANAIKDGGESAADAVDDAMDELREGAEDAADEIKQE